jgi:hypothetical protein
MLSSMQLDATQLRPIVVEAIVARAIARGSSLGRRLRKTHRRSYIVAAQAIVVECIRQQAAQRRW